MFKYKLMKQKTLSHDWAPAKNTHRHRAKEAQIYLKAFTKKIH